MKYILRSTFLFQQINPNSEVNSSTSQKRVATSVNAGDSMSEQERIGSPSKSEKNEQQLPASTYSTPRKRKLSNKLRWTENKVKKQDIKIKRLQTQSRRLKKKLFNVEDILKKLQVQFAMTNENLASLKNINVQVCISASLLKLVMPDVLHF